MILDTGSDKFVAKTWATIKAELDKILGRSRDLYLWYLFKGIRWGD
jgi:hypothetical protein